MDVEGFDAYPILHNGRIYTILTAMDMTFREVRAMIDWLDARKAFPVVVGAAGKEAIEGGGADAPDAPDESYEPGPDSLYSCAVEGVVFDVDVQGFDILVLRREPPE